VAAVLGWHADGWLVTQFGVHMILALRVLCTRLLVSLRLETWINLGPRIEVNADGSAKLGPQHAADYQRA
jgi:hypothetical protein